MKSDLKIYKFESDNSVSWGKVEIRHSANVNSDEDYFPIDENDLIVATYSGHPDKQL